MSIRRMRVALGVMMGIGMLVGSPLSLGAHHGTPISYDMDHPWTTKATVTEFKYANPHPWLEFDRVNEKGETEHWTAELFTNPTFLLRAGWTKERSLQALKAGTVVELTLATSRAGGHVAVVRFIRNDKGELIVDAGALDNGTPGAGAGRGAGGREGR